MILLATIIPIKRINYIFKQFSMTVFCRMQLLFAVGNLIKISRNPTTVDTVGGRYNI